MRRRGKKRVFMDHQSQECLLASIVIPIHCFRQRSSMVRECLDALSQQTLSASLFEVVLVNNSPFEKKHWEESLQIFENKLKLKILHESERGSYAARNLGVRFSQGQILAFIDSDCIPDPQWLENGILLLKEKGKKTVIGGRVKRIGKNQRLNWIERHEKIFTLNQRKNIHSGGFIATANLMLWRDFFTEAGPFNSSLVASGDVDWSFRSQKLGGMLFYSNKVCVSHRTVSCFPEAIKRYRRKEGGRLALKKINAVALMGKNYAGFQARKLLSFRGFFFFPISRVHYFLRFIQKCEGILFRLGKSGLSG